MYLYIIVLAHPTIIIIVEHTVEVTVILSTLLYNSLLYVADTRYLEQW